MPCGPGGNLLPLTQVTSVPVLSFKYWPDCGTIWPGLNRSSVPLSFSIGFYHTSPSTKRPTACQRLASLKAAAPRATHGTRTHDLALTRGLLYRLS